MTNVFLILFAFVSILLEFAFSRFGLMIFFIVPSVYYFIGYRRQAYVLALILGLLSDILLNNPFGLSILVFSIVLTFIGMLSYYFDFTTRKFSMTVIIASTCLAFITIRLIEMINSGGDFTTLDANISLRYLISNITFAIAIYLIVTTLVRQKKDDRRLLEGIQF